MRAKVRGRVIVVGEATSGDVFDSPFGEMSGFAVHANHIEAILDKRLLTAVPGLIGIPVLFFCLLGLEFIFSFHWPAEIRGLAALTGAAVVTSIVSLLLINVLGMYVTTWPLLFLYGVLRYVEMRKHDVLNWLERKSKKGHIQ